MNKKSVSKRIFLIANVFLLLILMANFAGAASGVDIPTEAETGLSDSSIAAILTSFLNWLLAVVGIVALIGFVVSGLQYILSTGDEKRMEDGKRNMLYSIIGVLVVLGSFVIIQAIDKLLRGVMF